MSQIRACSWALLFTIALHDLSHLLDDGLRTRASDLALVSTPQWLALAVTMAVILRGPAIWAVRAALLLGLGTVAGFVLVHLVPFAPAAYADLDPSAFSWAVVFLPMALGVTLVVLSWRALGAPRAAEA